MVRLKNRTALFSNGGSKEANDRLSSWATANGESFDALNHVLNAYSYNVLMSKVDNTTVIIVLISATTLIVASIYLVSKKRREQ